MKLDILVFGAHPDDAELGCGATIIKHVELGYKVGVIDLTEGELGTRGTAESRRQEAEDASKVMGLSIRENMGFRDGWFEDNEDTRLAVIQKVREFQPEIVICNAPLDRHPDHGRAGKLVSEAAWLAGLSKIPTSGADGKTQAAWRPKHVLQYIQYKQFEPDLVLDCRDYVDKKMEAIKCYRSQFYDPNSKEPETILTNPHFLEMISSRMSAAGNHALIEYGEGFLSAFKPAIKNLFDLGY